MAEFGAQQRASVIRVLATEGYFLDPNGTSAWLSSYFAVDTSKTQSRCVLCALLDQKYECQCDESTMTYHLKCSHDLTAASAPISAHSSVRSSSMHDLSDSFENVDETESHRSQLLALAFAEAKIPYSVVNHPSVRAAFNLNVSVHTLLEYVRELNASVQMDVTSKISKAHAACLLCEATPVDNMTGSWLSFYVVTNKTSYYHKGLYWSGSLTGQPIADLIRSIVEDIETGGRVVIVSVCSDNRGDFAAGVQSFLDFYRPWAFFVRSGAYSIELIVKDAIAQVIPDFVEKLAASIAPFRHREVEKAFQMAQVAQPATPTLRIIKPVDVRWNSYYNAARRILDRWQAYVSALSVVANAETFTTDEWKGTLTAFCDAVKPFANAARAVEALDFDACSLWNVMAAADNQVMAVARQTSNDVCKKICGKLTEAYKSLWKCNASHCRLRMIMDFLDPQQRRLQGITQMNAEAASQFLAFCTEFLLRKESSQAANCDKQAIASQVEVEFGECATRQGIFSSLNDRNTFRAYWTAAYNHGVLIASPVLAMADVPCLKADIERPAKVMEPLVDDCCDNLFELLDAEMRIRLNARHALSDLLGSCRKRHQPDGSDDDQDGRTDSE